MHQEIAAFKKFVRRYWSKALAPIFALVVGAVMGNFLTEGRILDDCKYSSSFRIGTQSFNCGRRI
jgi:hypothetical protein